MSEELVQTPPTPEPPVADERNAVHPMRQRFLFVDIAAQRAKQLRRGALNRIALAEGAAPAGELQLPHKAERVAMEEVRRGFVSYDLPAHKPPQSKTEAGA
ncbi:MAG: DNA-directed RNA polymerase subunit omega [Acidobacteria bacterium]|nr:DNA-directed RNA polymerase subunit omega [Acidobacteriota bacterium]